MNINTNEPQASELRIFQIGFNKCATRSISHFLDLHGLRSEHWLCGKLAVSIRDAIQNGTKPLAEWPDANVFLDMEHIYDADGPIEGYKYFREIDLAYPEAKFILNTRNMEAWIRSRQKHDDGTYLEFYRNLYNVSEAEHVFAYWRRDWLSHHLEVLEHFSSEKSRQLLIWDIDAPDFSKIESFLDIPVDSKKWPHIR